MGEYAKYKGESVKIGTCEDMYYLRYDQRGLVQHQSGNVDVTDPETVPHLRFRFPFPTEDSISPGGFSDYSYGARVPAGFIIPEGVEHHSVQFKAANGYLLSVPCPESPEWKREGLAKRNEKTGQTVHLNGYGGAAKVVQQKLVDGQLWTVCQCNGCGSKWRLDEEMGLSLAVAFLEEAQQLATAKDSNWSWWRKMGARIRDGYSL
jgi:hypothetical protein